MGWTWVGYGVDRGLNILIYLILFLSSHIPYLFYFLSLLSSHIPQSYPNFPSLSLSFPVSELSRETSSAASVPLRGLRPYTNYSVQVAGLTKVGEGPASEPHFCTTEEDGEQRRRRRKNLFCTISINCSIYCHHYQHFLLYIHVLGLLTSFFPSTLSPLFPPSVPGPPAGVKVAVVRPGTVVVSWLPPINSNGRLLTYFIKLRGREMKAS